MFIIPVDHGGCQSQNTYRSFLCVHLRASYRTALVDTLARSDTSLCCDHLVVHNHRISRLSTSRHRHLSSCRPEQGRKVDCASQRDIPKGTMLPCVHHPTVLPAAAILTTYLPLSTVLSLDLMDISGEVQRDITHDITKTRLTAAGTVVPGAQVGELRNDIDRLNEQRMDGYCGSCYGGEPPEGGCCNSCDAVRESYTRRGWSFGNPGGIDQVRLPASSFLRVGGVQTLMNCSALRNTGRTISRSSRRKAATLPVSCG